MPELYLRIAEQPDDTLDAIAASMEARAADPAMRRICADSVGCEMAHASAARENEPYSAIAMKYSRSRNRSSRIMGGSAPGRRSGIL